MGAAVLVPIVLLAAAGLGFFVLITSRESLPSPARHAFLLYLLALNLWSVGTLAAWVLATAPGVSLLAVLIAGAAMPAGSFIFARACRKWPLPRLSYLATLTGLFVLSLAHYVLLIRLGSPGGRGLQLMTVLALINGLSLLALCAWLWLRIWRRVPRERNLLYWVLAAGLAVMALSVGVSFSPWRSYGLELFLAALSAALAGRVAFGRRLPTLPYPQQRSAGYALLSLFVVAFCALLAYGTQRFAGPAGALLILSSGLTLTGATVGFPEVAAALSAWIERVLLRSPYEARRMVEEVAEAAPAVLDLEPLVGMILERTLRTLDIRWGLFALWDRTERELHAVAVRGLPDDAVGAVWPGDHPLTRWLLQESIDRDVPLPGTQPAGDLPPLDTHWLVPVPLRDGAKGIFLYGPHTSGAGYTSAERGILDLLANETAAAVANAQLFRQVARARREWLQTFDALSDGVFLHDGQGRILRANRAFAQLVGRGFDEIIARPWYELIPVGSGPREACSPHRRWDAAGAISGYDLSYGDRRTLHVTVSALAESDDFCVHVVRDVTEERALQQQLAQAEKLAAIGEMLSGVAHELNNPLTTIIGFSELLQDADVPSQVRSDLQRIHRQAQHSSRIVQSLLTFARQSRIRVAEVDINTLLLQTIEFAQVRLESYDIALHLDLAEDLPQTLADAGQMQQVFLNLLNNAVQATSRQEGSHNLYLRSEATPTHIRVTVRDDGPGIPPELLRRVFDPFFTTKNVGEGTGLGLSICYGIMREHGGRIWAESELGQGATFYVELPIRHAASSAVPAPQHPSLKGRRILIIEDDEANSALIRRALEPSGADVRGAGDGLQGLEALAQMAAHGESPDLIIVDLKMPNLDGRGFYERLCRDNAQLASCCLFISGDTVRPETERFLDTCGCPCLRKPFSLQELDEAVATLLAGQAT